MPVGLRVLKPLARPSLRALLAPSQSSASMALSFRVVKAGVV